MRRSRRTAGQAARAMKPCAVPRKPRRREIMTSASSRPGGTYQLGDLPVGRAGFGAMQLAGPGVFGPPADREEAVAVLREAVALGVNHIDTADFYGPYVTNEIIREALAPYPDDLHLVTKVRAV